MQYLDDIITRLAEKCVGTSPSGYGGPFIEDTVTADSILITVDSTLITADETI